MWPKWFALMAGIALIVIATYFAFFPRRVQNFALRNMGDDGSAPGQFIASDLFIPFIRKMSIAYYFGGALFLFSAISAILK